MLNKQYIEDAKELMNPFLTIWFSLLFAIVIVIGLQTGRVEMRDALAGISGTLGTIIGYHFGRSSSK